MKHEDIRIGTLAGRGEKTAAYIREILPHGFESFQINFWKTLGGVNLKQLARETKEALDGSGAIVSSLGIYGNPLDGTDDARECLRGWKACIDNAHHFGTDLVCGFTGRVPGKPLPDSIPRFTKVFGELAQRAAGLGVRIAFENCWMDGNWQRGDWNIAHSPDAWELMFDAVPSANLGLEWEPCHQMCALIDPMPQLRTWVPKIFHVHGKDATIHHDVIAKHGVGGAQPVVHHRTPGFGDSNWTDIISELRKHGYRGSIDIEGWHDPVYRDELEMTGQVAGLNYLKRCRATYVPNPKNM
ncbi:MAG TPA: sugar phosphate isomerase/epimerase [Opitutaceae bacterium]|nr:sugar phosphate isomerase/epimerase [Opitutaceae bacterium]